MHDCAAFNKSADNCRQIPGCVYREYEKMCVQRRGSDCSRFHKQPDVCNSHPDCYASRDMSQCIQAGFVRQRDQLVQRAPDTEDKSHSAPAAMTAFASIAASQPDKASAYARAPQVGNKASAVEFTHICEPKHPQVPAHFGCCADDCGFDCARHSTFGECTSNLMPSLMCQWTGTQCVAQPHQYTVISKDDDGMDKFMSAMRKNAASLANSPQHSCSDWHMDHSRNRSVVSESVLKPDQHTARPSSAPKC